MRSVQLPSKKQGAPGRGPGRGPRLRPVTDGLRESPIFGLPQSLPPSPGLAGGWSHPGPPALYTSSPSQPGLQGEEHMRVPDPGCPPPQQPGGGHPCSPIALTRGLDAIADGVADRNPDLARAHAAVHVAVRDVDKDVAAVIYAALVANIALEEHFRASRQRRGEEGKGSQGQGTFSQPGEAGRTG